MPHDQMVIVALVANAEAKHRVKQNLRAVTPTSFPTIILATGEELGSKERARLNDAKHATILAPWASVNTGWLDELAVQAERHPDVVLVPGSPNVHGPQRLVLEEHQSVREPHEQGPYATNHRKHFAGITQPIEFAVDLVACAPGLWVRQALDTAQALDVAHAREKSFTTEVFRSLYRDRPIVLAQGTAVFSSDVRSDLIPGAPTTSPLVSLCMIVKDEEAMIGDALESVADLADEMIVYDTGSSDQTREIARAHGATVIEGEWREDFAWARNQTLNYATGAWILWIDADERVRGDKAALRVRLENPLAPFESFSIRIENATGGGLTSSQHYASRVFRRKDCLWRGAIHETVWYRDECRTSYSTIASEIFLEHLGYLDSAMIHKNKAARNIKISENNQSAASPEEAAMHEARSLTMAGKIDEAIALIVDRVIDGDSVAMYRLGILTLGVCYRLAGRFADAEAAIARYAECGYDPAFTHNELAQLAFARGDYAEALASASLVTEFVADHDGLTVTPDSLIGLKARCLAKLGRSEEAAHAVIDGLSRGVMDIHLAELLDFMDLGNVPLQEVLRTLPGDKEPLVIAQLLQIDPLIADPILDQLHNLRPHDRTILAAASLVARHLDAQRRQHWSEILSSQGLRSVEGELPERV